VVQHSATSGTAAAEGCRCAAVVVLTWCACAPGTWPVESSALQFRMLWCPEHLKPGVSWCDVLPRERQFPPCSLTRCSQVHQFSYPPCLPCWHTATEHFPSPFIRMTCYRGPVSCKARVDRQVPHIQQRHAAAAGVMMTWCQAGSTIAHDYMSTCLPALPLTQSPTHLAAMHLVPAHTLCMVWTAGCCMHRRIRRIRQPQCSGIKHYISSYAPIHAT
jgi:hypothetical protein